MMVQTPLTEDQLASQQELLDCYRARSHPTSLAPFVKIKDETTQSIIPFNLWGWQKLLLEQMLTRKYLIVLKGRQLGVSWLAALTAVWTANFYPNSSVLLISKGQDEADKLLTKCAFIFMNMPSYMRAALMKRNNSELLLGFDWDNDLRTYRQTSTITALPATQDAGRSETATLVIADEWAYHDNAEKNFVSIQPTIDAGNARFIAISTANGTGNFFATNYKMAVRGENSFHPVFLPYNLRPGRDEVWYEAKRQTFKATPMLLHQEYPRDPEEAFIASGGCIFDLGIIREMEKGCRDPLPADLLWEYPAIQDLVQSHGLKVWARYDWSHAYVMWLDPATGPHGGDYSALLVMDYNTREVVAAWYGKRDENYVGGLADTVGRYYGMALYGIDRTGIGQSVLNLATHHLGYPPSRFYHHRDITKAKVDQKKDPTPGWPASRQGNQLQEALGRNAVANRALTIYDQAILDEMKVFVEDPETHKVEAKLPDHDDKVRALLGCLYLCELPEASKRQVLPQLPPKPRSRLAKRRKVIAA